MKTFFKKKKTVSKQKSLSKRIKHLGDTVWSPIIRTINPRCSWCGTVFDLQAHHIVAKGITGNNKHCWFLIENGMTLCFRCHIHRLKSEVDEYIEMRDNYLKERGLNYMDMKRKYQCGAPFREHHLTTVRIYLQQIAKKLKS